MAKPMDLTPEARQGYEGKPNTYLATSPSWYAWHLGALLQKTGRTMPRDVRMGRGNSIRANSMRFDCETWERIE